MTEARMNDACLVRNHVLAFNRGDGYEQTGHADRFLAVLLCSGRCAGAEVRAWADELTIPTYVWQEDVNPKFWALEGGAKMSTTVQGAIVYPYVMQDHLLREKVDRTYKALFLENEYLKVTCLPRTGWTTAFGAGQDTGQSKCFTATA